MAEFEVEFKVDAKPTPRDTYKRFIEGLRPRLGERLSHNVPILPRQERHPTRWFDIALRTDSHRTRVRLQRNNLYLVAYQRENTNQWWELNDPLRPNVHQVPGSTFLGFDGSYGSLANAAGATVASISLGQQPLIAAVDGLATFDAGPTRARSLIVVIQMICESIRFKKISDHLTLNYQEIDPAKQKPPLWMQSLVTFWGRLSGELRAVDSDPTHRFQPVQVTGLPIIDTAEKARAVVGIILGVPPPALIKRMTAADDNGGHQLPLPQGRPLVEVFSVRVDGLEDPPRDLYGTITIADGLGSQYIYRRERGGSTKSITRPGETALLLSGPARSIAAYDSFTINVALAVAENDGGPSSGQIWWNPFNANYDKPILHEVKGGYGSATVGYVVLSDAVQATVEVTLVTSNNGDAVQPAAVYGVVAAEYPEFLTPTPTRCVETVLFYNPREQHIDVQRGELIPLSRCLVAVPLDSSLVIRANLWDHGRVPPDDDYEIAMGRAEFAAQLSGTTEKNISGKFGEVRVKVTWTREIY